MAFGTETVWEVQPGVGSDTANGGGFDSGATMATDLAATSANTSSPIATSASYNFVAGDVGARLFIKSGTNWIPGWYTIASVASNAATLTATIGSAVLYLSSQPGALNTVVGCATTASPTSGTWSIDYSVRATPIYSYTDMVIGGTTTQFTSAANPVGPNIVGNIIAVTSGTGFTVQWILVSSVSGTTATCDKSLGTTASTGGNGGLGGALTTPGKAASLHVGSNIIFVKGGTSSLSSSSNVAGGKISLAGGAVATTTTLIGYSTIRTLINTDTSRPIFQPATATNNLTMVITNAPSTIRNIDFQNGNSCTACIGVDTGGNSNIIVDSCKFSGLRTGIRHATSSGQCIMTANDITLSNEANAIGIDQPGGSSIRGCYIHGGTGSSPTGISGTTSMTVADTVIANITGTSAIGISAGNNNQKIENVTIYNITQFGIHLAGTSQGTFIRNIYCEACGTRGLNLGGKIDNTRLLNCAGFNNGANYDTSNATTQAVQGFITCTVSALTMPGSGDFTLNNIAGGGALLRSQGFPTTIAGLTQTNYRDVGVYQHADLAAGGLINLGTRGGFTD